MIVITIYIYTSTNRCNLLCTRRQLKQGALTDYFVWVFCISFIVDMLFKY